MAPLDNAQNILLSENIHKEERLRWNHPATAALRAQSRTIRDSGGFMLSPRKPQFNKSAALRFLEEKTGLVPPANEYNEANYKDLDSPRPDTRELLYHGVSQEGNGRLRYLQERKKYGVVERNFHPMTTQQGYGVNGLKDENTIYTASPNAKKPIIHSSFFRTMGVETYKGLPPA